MYESAKKAYGDCNMIGKTVETLRKARHKILTPDAISRAEQAARVAVHVIMVRGGFHPTKRIPCFL